MRSMTAPDIIEAVVAANKANAPKKTPEALSAIFGPMYWAESPQPQAIALAYSAPDMPIAPSLNVSPVGNPQ